MTEHSVSDNIDRLPNWSEQLLFAQEVNECMVAGCTGYIYWYMRAHWAFVGTGESKYNPGNTKNTLLPRAFVMSHFSKYLTGSTRMETSADASASTNAEFETSVYIKGDSLIVIAINAAETDYTLSLKLPFSIYSGEYIRSTSNESLCVKGEVKFTKSVKSKTLKVPANSVNTYVLMIDNGQTGVILPEADDNTRESVYYDLHGRLISEPSGLCIERMADGTYRKIFVKD